MTKAIYRTKCGFHQIVREEIPTRRKKQHITDMEMLHFIADHASQHILLRIENQVNYGGWFKEKMQKREQLYFLSKNILACTKFYESKW